jgi:hypothetical protein
MGPFLETHQGDCPEKITDSARHFNKLNVSKPYKPPTLHIPINGTASLLSAQSRSYLCILKKEITSSY